MKSFIDTNQLKAFSKNIVKLVKQNVLSRPLLDNHSIPIFLIIDSLRKVNTEFAKSYIREIFHHIIAGYRASKRLPDAGNNIENVIKFVVTNAKSVFYHDETSLLLGMIFEHLAVLDMEKEYDELRAFVLEVKIDVALFVPFSDSIIKQYLPKVTTSMETRLFTSILNEGYQSEIKLDETFNDFKEKTKKRNEGTFSFLTDKTKFAPLITLAHIFNGIPFFPDRWRNNIK